MQQIQLDQLQRFDPLAVSPLVEDRDYFYYLIKRLIDLVLATFFLVVLSPIMLMIAILIYLDSGGPVIFSQERVGSNRWTQGGFSYWKRTRFTCFKFRTMVKNADESLHRSYVKALINNDHTHMAKLQGENTNTRKLVRDPRITRLGRFLRKSSLDELPQFWNVIKGDMSLVGPRPPVVYEVEEYEPWHLQRLEALPGLTGLWQVSGRSSMDFDDAVRLDIQYINNRSFMQDLKIILKTPIAIITTRGAM